MRVVTINCSELKDEDELWRAYLSEAKPEEGGFGQNLNAFWDAVSAGGPGWPGEDCELRFINTAPLKRFRNGKFYEDLKDIAARSGWVRIYVE